MSRAALIVFALSFFGSASAFEVDPDAACVVHVRKGETIKIGGVVSLAINMDKMREDQTAYCLDDGAGFSNPQSEAIITHDK